MSGTASGDSGTASGDSGTASGDSGTASGDSGTFDALVHAPHRLQICAVLDTVDQAEFALLRETLGVSDSVLSKQIKALEEAGYVKVSKSLVDRRTRTWVHFTRAGRRAYAGHVAALRAILDGGSGR